MQTFSASIDQLQNTISVTSTLCYDRPAILAAEVSGPSLSNSEDRLTQTGDVTHSPTRNQTAKGNPKAKSKGLKGKALKQRLSDARPEVGARQSKPKWAGQDDQEIESNEGASNGCESTDSESDNAGQNGSDDTEGESTMNQEQDRAGRAQNGMSQTIELDQSQATPSKDVRSNKEADCGGRTGPANVTLVTSVLLAKASALMDGYRKDPYKTHKIS